MNLNLVMVHIVELGSLYRIRLKTFLFLTVSLPSHCSLSLFTLVTYSPFSAEIKDLVRDLYALALRLPHRPCIYCIYGWNRKSTSFESHSRHLLRWLNIEINNIFSLGNIFSKYLNSNTSCESAYFKQNFILVVYIQCVNLYTCI
jgi:hypothetical protein